MTQVNALNLQISRIVRESLLFGPLVLERKQFLDMALDEDVLRGAENILHLKQHNGHSGGGNKP